MPPTSNSPLSYDGWEPADGSEIARLSQSLKRRESRRRFLKISGTVAGILAVGAVTWTFRWATQDKEDPFGNISCQTAIVQIQLLKNGAKLSEAELVQVKEHVRRCPHCKVTFEQMGGEKLFSEAIPVCHTPKQA